MHCIVYSTERNQNIFGSVVHTPPAIEVDSERARPGRIQPVKVNQIQNGEYSEDSLITTTYKLRYTLARTSVSK